VAETRLRLMELLKNSGSGLTYSGISVVSCRHQRSQEPAIYDLEAIPMLLSNMKNMHIIGCLYGSKKGWYISKSVLDLWTKQDHGKYWVVVAIDGARHVEGPIPTSKRNN